MVFLLLLSTTSWTVEKHLCMGRVMDIALFSHADDCSMKVGSASSEDEYYKVKKPCCDDEAFTLQGQDDLSYNKTGLDFSQKIFLYSFTSIYLSLFVDTTEKDILHDFYPTPILARDLNILHQVFLI